MHTGSLNQGKVSWGNQVIHLRWEPNQTKALIHALKIPFLNVGARLLDLGQKWKINKCVSCQNGDTV